MFKQANAFRRLTMATGIYIACFALHNADHARRGVQASPEPVMWAGTAVAMLSATLVTLVVVRHRLAPICCAVGGTAIATGVMLSHLLPKWGVLSDPVLVGGIDGWTRVAVMSEIMGAAVLAAAGWRSLNLTSNTKPQ